MRIVRLVGGWLALGLILLFSRRRQRKGLPPARARAQRAVILLLQLATLCSVAFIVVYAVNRIPKQTQYLGLSLGLALAFLAAAAIATGRALVPNEEHEEPYRLTVVPEEQERVVDVVEAAGQRVTRRRLLGISAGGAVSALGLALVTPAVSLGPVFDPSRLKRSPWGAGIPLLDSDGRPLRVDEVEADTFYTAFPAGAERDDIGSPLVVVRLDPDTLELSDGRAGWAPDGVVAYSKICTHAGCAIALYRTPLYEPTSSKPALICPCHYSTFDPAAGGKVLFGPAGRPLPQLPLAVREGRLVAAGELSSPPGPSWWGVR